MAEETAEKVTGAQSRIGQQTGPSDQISVRRLEDNDQATAKLSLGIDGSLSIATISRAWEATLEPIRKSKPKQVSIDARHLDYCDGAGLGLMIEIRRELATWGGKLEFEHLSPELGRLFDMAVLADPSAPQLRPPARGMGPGVSPGTTEAHG